MSHVAHKSESCCKYDWVMPHTWRSHAHTSESRIVVSHVTHMSESCRTRGGVISRVSVSDVTHMSGSCHTHEWVMLRTRMSHVTRMSLHIRMSHVTHANESCHAYKWDMSHTWSLKSRATASVRSFIWVGHVKPYTLLTSYVRMNHLTHAWSQRWRSTMSQSCHAYEWVISHRYIYIYILYIYISISIYIYIHIYKYI